MKSKLILMFALIGILSLTLSSSQYSLNNKNIPTLGPTQTITSSGGGSGNVTSVSSGDNCIFVSPTTGDVQITFNTSCGGSGSGDGSFNITYQTFAYNQTSPALNYVRTYYYNKTEIDSFNASWISTFNITYQTWAYNQTTAVFNTVLLNNTIAQYGNLIGFNSTYNATYAQFAYNQTRAINPFNQDLNTTNTPTFTGANFFGQILSDIPGGLGTWHRYTVLGGAFPIGFVTSENFVFQISPENGFDLYMGNFSTSTFVAGNTNGLSQVYSANSFITQILGAGSTFETNLSRTTIYGNSSIKGTNHDWAVPNGFINATGVNITSNHQILYPNYSLDSLYKNDYGRPMILTASIGLFIDGVGEAYVYINKTTDPNNGADPSCVVGVITPFVTEDLAETLVCPIKEGENFKLISAVSSSSTISLGKTSIMLI